MLSLLTIAAYPLPWIQVVAATVCFDPETVAFSTFTLGQKIFNLARRGEYEVDGFPDMQTLDNCKQTLSADPRLTLKLNVTSYLPSSSALSQNCYQGPVINMSFRQTVPFQGRSLVVLERLRHKWHACEAVSEQPATKSFVIMGHRCKGCAGGHYAKI